MKNFLTGAFLVFTGATLTILGLLAIATLTVTLAPTLPVWLQTVLLIAGTFTVVLVGLLNDIGKWFYNWKNGK